MRCPRYRWRVLGGSVAIRCGELLELVIAEHDWQIFAEVVADHMHLFVRVGPNDTPASVVRGFKGRTPQVLRDAFAYVWESTVRRYVECQCDVVVAS